MNQRRFFRAATQRWALPAALVGLLSTTTAFALQPIADFVRGAEATHPELLEAAAVRAQRKAEQQGATWRLLPSFSAAGSYTRNQYEVAVALPGRSGPEPIIAENQFDASLKLSVPIVNVAAWETKAAMNAQLDLANANVAVVSLDLRRRVARAYYQLLATSAVRQAAERSLALAKESALLAGTRRQNGAATQLEVERASADTARAAQDVTASVLAQTLARRELQTLSGLEPANVGVFPSDDLHGEAPLTAWTARADSVPALEAARAAERSAKKQASAAQASLYPVVTGSAEERFTNATALFGAEAFYA
ncbi:MAG TPA: TolC family protein, partial [Polyangiaceae bacterium]|nr:TolC family protein [Polyangiaceae bacterium]